MNMCFNRAYAIYTLDQIIKKDLGSIKNIAQIKIQDHVCRGYRIELFLPPIVASKYQTIQLKSGGDIKILSSKNSHQSQDSGRILLSLHGGPDSYENIEMRYLGLYDNYLQNGHTVIILNYAGSLRTMKTQDWESSIQSNFKEVEFILKRQFRFKKIQYDLFAVSFGATLATFLLNKFNFHKVTLICPLLDLTHHQKRIMKLSKSSSEKRKYQSWLKKTFSHKDYKSIRLDRFVSIYEKSRRFYKKNFKIILSANDEILGRYGHKKLISNLKKSVFIQNTPHVPEHFDDLFVRYLSHF